MKCNKFIKALMLASFASAIAASTAFAADSVQGKTVAFIPKLTGNAFFESANAGAQAYSKKVGYTVEYMGSPNASVADEVNVINQAVARGVDAI